MLDLLPTYSAYSTAHDSFVTRMLLRFYSIGMKLLLAGNSLCEANADDGDLSLITWCHACRKRRQRVGAGAEVSLTTPHLSGELLKTMARLNIVHVPYKGEAPAIIDVIAGHLPL